MRKKNRLEHIQQLDTEIEGRFSFFLVACKRMVRVPCDKQFTLKSPYTTESVRQQWEKMKLPPNRVADYPAILPQFANRSTVSLVTELSNYLKIDLPNVEHDGDTTIKEDDDLSVDDIAVELTVLQAVILNLQDDRSIDVEPSGSRRFLPIWRSFRHNILARRWTQNSPYTDCDTTPFCNPTSKLSVPIAPGDVDYPSD